MTRRIILSLDLNENDLDALQMVLANPAAIARSVAANDPREQIRIVDVLAEMAGGVSEALAHPMANAIDK
ncbi:hypothetical protein [Pseudomonas aeruginosa]|uniref:hypothetical protein n=1 Tax=Pseudomonas aeruginosa TaxID=287 RepID=UPI0025AEF2D5|nr:hypothetical protein [Pseudomonas aeruginosa]